LVTLTDNVPYTDLHIGASGKFISSTLETYNSLGGALDIGAIYIDQRNDVNWVWLSETSVLSLLPIQVREKNYLEIMFGVSQELENVPIRWHLTLEL
jgi:hypothetical protein